MFGQGSNELIKWNVNLNPRICQTSAWGFNTEQASVCQGGGNRGLHWDVSDLCRNFNNLSLDLDLLKLTWQTPQTQLHHDKHYLPVQISQWYSIINPITASNLILLDLACFRTLAKNWTYFNPVRKWKHISLEFSWEKLFFVFLLCCVSDYCIQMLQSIFIIFFFSNSAWTF